MEELIKQLLSNGIPGVMLAFFIWYLNKQDGAHKEERKQWTDRLDNHVDKFTSVVDKNTTALVKMEETLKDAKCNYSNR